ncbi:MAG: acyl-CoA thioesterase [Victivallales bacterium]|nr:acyl-CoA thioesterase [Victivallales bacterium]
MEDYSSAEIRVIYGDTDQMGVVYHANYLKYLEVGRTEMLRQKGIAYRDIEAMEILLQVVQIDIKYHRPAQYDDIIEVRSRVAEMGPASVLIENEICRDGQLLVSARVKLASVSAITRRIAPIPKALRAVLEK